VLYSRETLHASPLFRCHFKCLFNILEVPLGLLVMGSFLSLGLPHGNSSLERARCHMSCYEWSVSIELG